MKTKLLFLIFSFIASSCYMKSIAQTQQGHFMVGGMLSSVTETSKSSSSPGKRTYKTFNTEPRIGYFVSENFAVGLGLGYNREKLEQRYSESYESKSSSIIFRPFSRYYFNVSDKFKAYGEAAIGLGWQKESDTRRRVLTIGLAPGLAFFPTKHIGIDLQVNLLSYYRSKLKDDGISYSITNIGPNLNAPTLGVQFFF